MSSDQNKPHAQSSLLLSIRYVPQKCMQSRCWKCMQFRCWMSSEVNKRWNGAKKARWIHGIRTGDLQTCRATPSGAVWQTRNRAGKCSSNTASTSSSSTKGKARRTPATKAAIIFASTSSACVAPVSQLRQTDCRME